MMNNFEEELKDKILSKGEEIEITCIDVVTESGKHEKQYVCPILTCGKVMSYKGNLRVHLETHVGFKPYVCDFPGCTKRFS